MISKTKHTFSVSLGETLENLRIFQLKHKFIIPSDYVYFLLNYNNFKFDTPPSLKNDEKLYLFYQFFNLEEIVIQLEKTRSLSQKTKCDYWLADYLCIGQLDDKWLIIGNQSDNSNLIYIYDKQEEDFLDLVCDDLFEFIEVFLIY